jgi:1-phosphofructokinase
MRSVTVFAPTPLITVTVERSAAGDDQLHIHLGGQGIWVGRLVARLGVPVSLCTALGGETGAVAAHLLEQTGIEIRSVSTVGWNGGYLHDRRLGERQVLADVGPGPLLRHELDDLYSMTLASAFESGVCVLTGTHLYPVVPDSVYRRLAHDCHANGIPVITDLSGSQLNAALDGGVTLVKVSRDDMIRDGWMEPGDSGLAACETALAQLVEAGADGAVISCGADPAQVLIDGVRYEVITPVMETVDHRGAGDAMTGMLAVGILRGLPTEELLRSASAAGAATVVRHGYATGTLDAVNALAHMVEVRRLGGAGETG